MQQRECTCVASIIYKTADVELPYIVLHIMSPLPLSAVTFPQFSRQNYGRQQLLWVTNVLQHVCTDCSRLASTSQTSEWGVGGGGGGGACLHDQDHGDKPCRGYSSCTDSSKDCTGANDYQLSHVQADPMGLH